MYEDFNELFGSLSKWAKSKASIKKGHLVLLPKATAKKIANSMLIPLELHLYRFGPIKKETRDFILKPLTKVVEKNVKFADYVKNPDEYIKNIAADVTNAIKKQEIFIPLPLVEKKSK